MLVGCCAKALPPIQPLAKADMNPHPYKAFTHIYVEPIENPETRKEVGPELYDYLKAMQTARGSGIVIENVQDSEILTAGHVCENPGQPDDDDFFLGNKISVYDWQGNGWEAEVISVDHDNDLCLLKVQGVEYPNKVELAKVPPTHGEKLFLAASPLGVFMPGAPLLHDGYFGGVDIHGWYITTIPVAPGSSGGGVVNRRGQLVGIVVAGIINFPDASILTSLEEIRNFLNEIK